MFVSLSQRRSTTVSLETRNTLLLFCVCYRNKDIQFSWWWLHGQWGSLPSSYFWEGNLNDYCFSWRDPYAVLLNVPWFLLGQLILVSFPSSFFFKNSYLQGSDDSSGGESVYGVCFVDTSIGRFHVSGLRTK